MFAELEATLNIEASEVGTIAAWSLYPLLLFQIPFGILIDKFGPRRITSAAVLSTALGCLIFAMSYNTVTACFGRFLIGMGSAAAFPYVVKIISNWFKPKYFAIFLGATISLGMLGILAGEILLSSHILHYGWRLSMIHFSILGFILSGFYFFTIRDKDPSVRYDMNPKDRNFDFKKSFKKLLKNKQTWILTIYTAFAEAPLPVFIGLWAIPFLTSVHHLTVEEASLLNGYHLLAVAIFCPIIAYFSTKIKRRKIFIKLGTLTAMIFVTFILYPVFPHNHISTMISFFIMGIGAAAIPLSYTVMHEQAVPGLTATSLSILNTFYALLGASGDQVIGFFLDHHWSGTYSHKLRFYTPQSLEDALYRIPIWFALAFIISFFIKETKAKQKYFEK